MEQDRKWSVEEVIEALRQWEDAFYSESETKWLMNEAADLLERYFVLSQCDWRIKRKMTYAEAKDLKPGDVVMYKNHRLLVSSIEDDDEHCDVYIFCDDVGQVYHHTVLELHESR